MKALVFEGKIVQIEVEEFPVAPALTWINITGITPAPKVSWSYDSVTFTAPPPLPLPPPKSAAPLTAEELADHLITKNVITQGEIDAIKAAR